MDAIEVLKRIREAGIIATLPGNLPLQSILPVGDALMAAPVQAVEVENGHNAATIITDLSQRAGAHMLVGAGLITTAAQAEMVIAAGAQFVTSPRLNETVMARCQARAVLYVPGVISMLAARAAYQSGCRLIRLRTGGPAGPDYVNTVRTALPELGVVVAADITAANVGHYVRAGAVAVVVGRALFSGPDQPISEVITNARRLQRAWELKSPGTWQNGGPSGSSIPPAG